MRKTARKTGRSVWLEQRGGMLDRGGKREQRGQDEADGEGKVLYKISSPEADRGMGEDYLN